jgi:hypothetical protein
MPYAKIETNIKLDSLKEQKLLKAASSFFASLLEKSDLNSTNKCDSTMLE